MRRILLEPRQARLLAVSVDPAGVGSVGFLDPCTALTISIILTIIIIIIVSTSVVRNVLALGVDSVESLVDRLGGVVPVLPDDALGLLQELVYIAEYYYYQV